MQLAIDACLEHSPTSGQKEAKLSPLTVGPEPALHASHRPVLEAPFASLPRLTERGSCNQKGAAGLEPAILRLPPCLMATIAGVRGAAVMTTRHFTRAV